MAKQYTVYLLIFPNNKKYCGYTSMLPEKRWKHGTGYKATLPVGAAIKKYGWDNIKKEILLVTSNMKEALQYEKFIIKKLNLLDNKYGYNLDAGGIHTGNGNRLSAKGAEKISNQLKNKWKNPEYRKKQLQLLNSSKKYKFTTEDYKKAAEWHKNNTPKNAIAVEQRNFKTHKLINTFDSASAAAKTLNHSGGGHYILEVCRNTRRSAYGYYWTFKK